MVREAHLVFDLLVFVDFFGNLNCFCRVFDGFVLRLKPNLEYLCMSKDMHEIVD